MNRQVTTTKLLVILLTLSIVLISYLWTLLLMKNDKIASYTKMITIGYELDGIYKAKSDFIEDEKKYYELQMSNEISASAKSAKTFNGLPVWILYYTDEETEKKWKQSFIDNYNQEMKRLIEGKKLEGGKSSVLPTLRERGEIR